MDKIARSSNNGLALNPPPILRMCIGGILRSQMLHQNADLAAEMALQYSSARNDL